MGDLTAEQFDDFFNAVHSFAPYPWQSRLARQVLEADWPDVIDLPTGVGKTAVLDIAVFALAARPAVSPRRIVFVIDRRIVVDQVYKHAEGISKALSEASGGVLAAVQAKLRELSDDPSDGEPIGISALRGGIPLDGAWAQRPDQPWVMVSTVDQFGSRLLFRGYGLSDRSRPIHAGLAGNDCLVILDEVHLSRAFASTLADATSDVDIPMMRSLDGGLPRRFKIVEMSATPQSRDSRFGLQPEDSQRSEPLRKIVEAKKHAELVEVKGKPHEKVPKKVVEIIKNSLHDDERSVGVIVNRVRTAHETCQALQDSNLDVDVHLVTGRMRPIDRQAVMREIERCVDPGRTQPLEKRTVVVATQAIEVGADFSFDALITECSPSDSLAQRLGRLDRRGTLSAARHGPARCWVLGLTESLTPKNPDDPRDPKNPDPVYAGAVFHTWMHLQDRVGESGEIDVSPVSGVLASMPAETRAPATEAPLLLPTHVNAWTQTNPQPVADPPIGEFLHGKEREQQPDVTLVWRWDRSEEALSLVPPRQAEFLSVPIAGVKRWLAGEEEIAVSDLDLAAVEDRPSGRQARRSTVRRPRLTGVVRWSRSLSDPVEPLRRVDEIKPGDVLVVDPRIGGLRNGTWDPSAADAMTAVPVSAAARDADPSPHSAEDVQTTEVADLGDQAQLAHGHRATLRLDTRLFSAMTLARLEPPFPRDEQNASSSRREILEDWLQAVTEAPETLPTWLRTIVSRLRSEEHPFDIEIVGSGSAASERSDADADESYYVLVERAVDPSILDESDDAPSLTGAETTLSSHLMGVGDRAAVYGERLGLSALLVADLRLAGELHDLGKIDGRFQAQMAGHDPVRLAILDEPLAKSVRGARTRKDAWPPVRHEFSSVALANSAADVLAMAHDRDLVLHLVGTHHGYGRPLPAIRADEAPRPLEVSGLVQDGGFRLVSLNGVAVGPSAISSDGNIDCRDVGSADSDAADHSRATGEGGYPAGLREGTDDEFADRQQPGERRHTTGTSGESTDGSVTMAACSDLGATSLALDMADRFWRLQEHYGHHGLAWLEAIFRLADQQQSAEEARRA